MTTGIHAKYFEDQNLSLTQPARHREPLRRGGREIGQKGTFFKGLRGVFLETRFIADSMLGRLAKWLRVLGYDTLYQPFYRQGVIGASVREGRRLLSRHRSTVTRYADSMLIRSDYVKDQLYEMKKAGTIRSERSRWFSRCLLCNVPLQKAEGTHARDNVPV